MRMVWNLVGLLFVGLGTAGILIPGLPATVFFILALYSFTRGSNEVWRERLLNHKVVGSTLRHWEEHRSISRRIKWVASVCIVLSVGYSAYTIPPIWVKAVVITLGFYGVWYVLTRPTTEDIELREKSGEFEGQAA